MFIILKGQAIGYTPLSYEVSKQKQLNDRSELLEQENLKNNISSDKIFIDDKISTGNSSLNKKNTQENLQFNRKQTIFPLINLKKPLFQNKGAKMAADLLNNTPDLISSYNNTLLNESELIDKITDLEAIQRRLNEKDIFSRFLNKQTVYFNSEDIFRFKISAVYKKGDIFGTEWLNSNTKRIISVIAEEPLSLLYINREYFIKAIEKEELRMKAKTDFMTKIFKGTEFTDVKGISCHLVEQKYDIHDVIFYEGQKTQGFYFLKQGEVEVLF